MVYYLFIFYFLQSFQISDEQQRIVVAFCFVELLCTDIIEKTLIKWKRRGFNTVQLESLFGGFWFFVCLCYF